MANDNTLGAPTEGLGQRVTFAFGQGARTPTLEIGQGSTIRAGVVGEGTVGAGNTRATGVRVEPNPTIELLGRIGDDILKPRLQRARTENFVAGMQRAMQGEAVADIARDQPWYSTLFGESDVVEGARAYAGHAVAQEAVSAMEDNMPKLRQMGPQDAQAFFTNEITSRLTGDAATDATVMKSMTQALPSVMRRQAKEHYGWLQENATAAEAAAFRSGAVALQRAARSGVTTPEEMAVMRQDFVASLQPAAGRDLKGYKESMKDNLVLWATNGNFHALNAVLEPVAGPDGKSMSFGDVLDADQRAQVQKAIEAGEAKARAKYSFDWNDDLAKIEAQATFPNVGQTATDIATQIDAINARYSKETGSRSGLISPAERKAMVSGSAVAIVRERMRQAEADAASGKLARTAEEKAAAAARKVEVIRQHGAQGGLGWLAASTEYSRPEINVVATQEYNSLGTQEEKNRFLVNNLKYNYTIDPVKDMLTGTITSALSSEQYTPEVQAAFDQYAKLRETNRFAADAYYGKHATALEGFYNDVQAGMAPAGAFRDRFVNAERRGTMSKEDLTATVKVISDEYNSWLPQWAGGAKLAPGTARRVATLIGNDVQRMAGATNGDTKEAATRVYRAALSNGLEVMGGYAWQNGKGQTSLSQYLTTTTGPEGQAPVATDRINEEVNLAVEELLYGGPAGAGILPDNASDTVVIRLPDAAGVPQFHVQAVVGGKVFDGRLLASDVFGLAAKRKAAKAASLTAGPKLTNIPPPRQPSIYASQEEWAAYRQWQAEQAAK